MITVKSRCSCRLCSSCRASFVDTATAGITKQYRGALGFLHRTLTFWVCCLMLMIIGLVGKISTKYAYPAFAGLTSNRSGDDENNRKVRGWWSLPTKTSSLDRWRCGPWNGRYISRASSFLRSLFLMPRHCSNGLLPGASV